MIYVEGFKEEVKKDFDKEKHGFFIDRCEVTNNQYKEFVDSAGYRDPKYWKNEFKKDGKIITWDKAMTYFTDNTGRPGPYTWEAGDYPDGKVIILFQESAGMKQLRMPNMQGRTCLQKSIGIVQPDIITILFKEAKP
jgi:formylglycine-generating enzyme required for sulfatase activity